MNSESIEQPSQTIQEQLARDYVAAYNNRDLEKFKAFHSEDATAYGFINLKTGEIESEHGRDQIIKRFEENIEMFKGKFNIKQILVSGDKICADLDWKIYTPLHGEITLRLRSINTVRNGLTVHIDMLIDYFTLMKAATNVVIEQETDEIIKEYMKHLIREELLPKLKNAL